MHVDVIVYLLRCHSNVMYYLHVGVSLSLDMYCKSATSRCIENGFNEYIQTIEQFA